MNKCVPETVKGFGNRQVQVLKDYKNYLVDQNNNLEYMSNLSTIMGRVGGFAGSISPLLRQDLVGMASPIFYGSLAGMGVGGFIGLGLDMVSDENRKTIKNCIPNNLKMSNRSVSNYSALGNNVGTVVGGGWLQSGVAQ